MREQSVASNAAGDTNQQPMDKMFEALQHALQAMEQKKEPASAAELLREVKEKLQPKKEVSARVKSAEANSLLQRALRDRKHGKKNAAAQKRSGR